MILQYFVFFIGVDDDVVKLYDLTALCSEGANDSPFTVPLGMLLYRVARNLWQQDCRKKRSTIRTLLENCLMLLDEDKHAQVFSVFLVSYMHLNIQYVLNIRLIELHV